MARHFKTSRWLRVNFESSCYTTEQFKSFVRDFRSDMKAILKGTDWTLHSLLPGHFYISGFIKNSINGKLMYFSISDVRFFQDEWHRSMLIRTAEHDKDWMGGMNHYTKFRELDLYLTNL